MKSKKALITKDSLIAQIVNDYPKLGEVLVFDYGFHCIGCGMAQMETLEEGAVVHGLSPKKIDSLVKKLNKIASSKGRDSKS